MKLLLSIAIALFTATAAHADVYTWNGYSWVLTQCGGCGGGACGGFCPQGGCGGGFCPGGNCGGGICYPQYPQQQPRPSQPEGPIDGEQYENPNQPTAPPTPISFPPLPAPPQPATPAIPAQPAQPGPPGDKGPVGDKGPTGDKGPVGDGGGIDKDAISVVVNAAVVAAFAKYEAEHKPQPSVLNFIGSDGKVVATATVTPGAETNIKLPPINFRVLDRRGPTFSTEYQPAYPGSYVTLPFGPAQ